MEQLDITSTNIGAVPLSWAGFTFVTAHDWGFAEVWVGSAASQQSKHRSPEPAASAAGVGADAAYLEQGWAQGSLDPKGGSRAGRVVCVVEFSSSTKLCSGFSNQEGPACDLWLCAASGAVAVAPDPGVCCGQAVVAEAAPGLVWAPLGAGTGPSLVSCIPETSVPVAPTPRAFLSPVC